MEVGMQCAFQIAFKNFFTITVSQISSNQLIHLFTYTFIDYVLWTKHQICWSERDRNYISALED